MNEFSLQDIISIGETVDLECKAAQGRDGNGEVPGSFWETYSAMANTNGGETRASFYLLPGKQSIALSSLFQDSLDNNSQDLVGSFQDLTGNSQDLVGSSPDLTPMLSESLLELKYPKNKNHPDQAYRKKQA